MMKLKRFTFFTACLGVLLVSSLRGQEALHDDFSTYPPGSAAASRWQVSSGFWHVNDSLLCESSGIFDAGIFLPELIDGAFEMTVRFRMRSPYHGVGFYFCSENPHKPAFAHMVRIDGEQVLFGYFLRGGYQATDAVALSAPIDSLWHTLRLRVSQRQNSYTLFIDERMIGTPTPLRFHTGYLGLQNSGGPACFDDFSLRPISDNRAGSPINWPVAVAVGGDGQVWVASPARHKVMSFTAAGNMARELYKNYPAHQALGAPTALAAFADSRIAVLDTLFKRVQIFSATGEWLQTIGDAPQRPVDLAVWPDGTLAVSDLSAGKIYFYTQHFQQRAALPWPEKLQATAIAAGDSTFAFYENSIGRIHLLSGRGRDWRAANSFPAPAGQVRGLALSERAVFVAVDDRVVRLDFHGNATASLDLAMMNDIFPQKLCLANGRLFIPDFLADRIVIVDTTLTTPALQSRFSRDGTLQLTWTSPVATPGRVEVRADTTILAKRTVKFPGPQHRFIISKIEPAQLLRVRYAPLLHTLPADTGLSRAIVLMPPPPRGKMQYMELRGAVILFANVIDSAKVQPDWPAMPPLSQQEIERIRRQVEDGRRFYWLNSGIKLHLALDYFVIDSLWERRSVFDEASYYPPRKGVIEKILQENLAEIANYQAVFYIACLRDFDSAQQRWELRGRGGAFTEGIGANGRYGISWWEATHHWHAAGNNWLVVHEFHHQLDELFGRSGYPEYWFNHFAPQAGTAAKFGEHFDGNAYILRHWPADRWFDLEQAKLQFAADADGDGIPDNAVHLPVDEVRLGSRSDRRDSDGDGVADRDEVAFSSWVVEGQGEEYAAPARLPNLATGDTDADGLADAVDPYPLYPWRPVLVFRNPNNQKALLGATTDPRAPYRLWGAWMPDSLFFFLALPKERRVRLLLDANADGWFVGQDNLEFRMASSDSGQASVQVFNAAAPEQWPFMDKALAKTVRYTWQFDIHDRLWQLAIARNPQLGLECQEGEEIGVDVGVSAVMDSAGHEKNLSIYEPNRFFNTTLSKAHE